MKRKILSITALFFMLLLVTACGKESTKYHAVSFDSNGAEEYQSRAVADNELLVEPRVPTRIGYSFLGWYDGEIKWNFDQDRVTDSMTLTAKWSRLKFIVKFDSVGGSSVEEQSVSSGDFATEPIPPTKENKKFAGWFDGENKWDFNTKRVTNFITLTAKWEDYPTYTVFFDSNGGTDVASQYKTEGSKADAPANPTKPNSKFIGWYHEDVEWDFAFNVINSNITLTAKWEDIPTFTVTFDSNGASPVSPQHIAVGEKAKEPPKPDRAERGELLGWFNGDTKWDFNTPITSDITLVAKWKNIYKITFRDGDVLQSISVEEGETVPKQADPSAKEYFRFIGWYLGDTKWNFDSDIPTSDITLDAKWEQNATYTVTFDSNGGESILPQYVREGELSTDPGIPPRDGYRFDGWYFDGKLWDFNGTKITKSITLVAKWVETVTVTFDLDNETNVKIYVYDKNTPAMKPIDPTKAGYRFDGWLLDGVLWDFNAPLTQSITLTAKWVKTFTVTFDSDGGSAVNSMIIDEGELIPEPDEPYKSSRFRFKHWYISGTDTAWDFETMTVTSDIVLKAKWQPWLPPVST